MVSLDVRADREFRSQARKSFFESVLVMIQTLFCRVENTSYVDDYVALIKQFLITSSENCVIGKVGMLSQHIAS
jgi:hypothetical protein